MAPTRKTPVANPPPQRASNVSTTDVPLLHRAEPGRQDVDTGPNASSTSRPFDSTPLIMPEPTVHAIRIEATQAAEGSTPAAATANPGSLQDYQIAAHLRAVLTAANAEGLRTYRGQVFADLDNATTVLLGWDEARQTYRARLLREVQPSGPALRYNSERKTWSLILSTESANRLTANSEESGPPPAKQPRLESTLPTQAKAVRGYIDTAPYEWNEAVNNHHGYVILHRKKALDDASTPAMLYAFRDDKGAFVSVEPSAPRIDKPAELMPAWTDRDLWSFYGIEGEQITRFRAEAHATGKKPQWANLQPDRRERRHLLDELRRWIAPDMDREMFISTLQALNLTDSALAQKLENANWHSRPALTPSTTVQATLPQSRVIPVGPWHESHYSWDSSHRTFQGYIEMHRKAGLDDNIGPPRHVAFIEGSRMFIVARPGHSIYQMTRMLPFWRDIEIWNLYAIHGEVLTRFRQEAARSGKPPAWARPREYPSLREQLIDYLRLWSSQHARPKPIPEFIDGLRSYNLSTAQLSQLRDELTHTGQYPNRMNNDLPLWAEAHRHSMLDETHSRRFEPFVEELKTEALKLRHQRKGPSVLKATLTHSFFQGLLAHHGFKRNRHKCLFRTDNAALFRGDDRTPFEFARDGALLARAVLAEGTTTQTAVSATVSLGVARNLAQKANPEALVYDTQLSRFPGRPGDSDRQSVTDRELHLSHDYTPKRRNQRIAFCYLLDTRGVEVVPGLENRMYNFEAIDLRPQNSKTWFPQGELEGHLSISPRGLSAARIWLVNSSMTRAATVQDIHTQALDRVGSSRLSPVDDIENRTWSGAFNRHEYDALIDEVAAAGKRIIEFAQGAQTFSDDTHFPPEVINLSP